VSTVARTSMGRPRRSDPITKENPGCWTRRRAFDQVRHGSNIQLLPYSLVSQGTGAVRTGLVLLTDPVRRIGTFQEGAEEESRQIEFSDQEGVR